MSIHHRVQNICETNKHQYTGVFNFAKSNIFVRPEEAMFVELVKACLTEKNILFWRKLNTVHFKNNIKQNKETTPTSSRVVSQGFLQYNYVYIFIKGFLHINYCAVISCPLITPYKWTIWAAHVVFWVSYWCSVG